MDIVKGTCASAQNAIAIKGAADSIPWWLPALAVSFVIGLAGWLAEPYLANVATSWLIFGLLGMSLALVWGQMGFLSLGQTAFYGLGGYIGSVVAINLAPLTGNSLLWSLPAGALAGAALAAAIGWVVFFGRMGALQATVVTYTLALVIWTVAVSFSLDVGEARIGGDNGMSNIPGLVLAFGADVSPLEPNGMFVTVLTICACAYLLVRRLLHSPFGLVIGSIRQNSEKAELLGFDIRAYQLALFAVAGAVAGIAGALYGAWGGYVGPSLFSAQEAMLVPMYVLVGGLGSLAGAFVGAAAVGALSFWLGGAAGGQATLVLGVVLILLVLFLRDGLAGLVSAALRRAHDPKSRAGGLRLQADAASLQRFVHANAPPASPSTGFSADRLYKRFGGVIPVNLVSRQFRRGVIHSLIGPNGAGKSSFLRCCTGLYRADSGHATLDGIDISRQHAFQRVCAGIGIKTQAPLVFRDFTVYENIWLAAFRRAGSRAAADDIANTMATALGLNELKDRKAGELPHGAQQWLDLAMVLSQAPQVLFLDEPAAGMSAAERKELAGLLSAIAPHMSIVVVEHDMDFVESLGGEVTVLHQGQVFAEGSIDSLRRDERVLDIYLGRRHHARAC